MPKPGFQKGPLKRVILFCIVGGIALWLVPAIFLLSNLHNEHIRHKAVPYIVAGFVVSGIGNIILAVWRMLTARSSRV